jgi:predicted RNA-binding Zn-ribbon protein involved in translation (DUF1610 family)
VAVVNLYDSLPSQRKGLEIDIYILLFLLIVGIGSVTIYIYYLKDKNEQLSMIREGICPSCGEKSIVLSDERSGGCCGPKLVTYRCLSCGYESSFSIDGGGCSL